MIARAPARHHRLDEQLPHPVRPAMVIGPAWLALPDSTPGDVHVVGSPRAQPPTDEAPVGLHPKRSVKPPRVRVLSERPGTPSEARQHRPRPAQVSASGEFSPSPLANRRRQRGRQPLSGRIYDPGITGITIAGVGM